MEVVWTGKAIRTLKAIYKYYAKFSPRAAKKIKSSIFARVDRLEKHPLAGMVDERFTPSGKIRYLIQSHWRIYYWVAEERIEILEVFDTRQDPDALKL